MHTFKKALFPHSEEEDGSVYISWYFLCTHGFVKPNYCGQKRIVKIKNFLIFVAVRCTGSIVLHILRYVICYCM